MDSITFNLLFRYNDQSEDFELSPEKGKNMNDPEQIILN